MPLQIRTEWHPKLLEIRLANWPDLRPRHHPPACLRIHLHYAPRQGTLACYERLRSESGIAGSWWLMRGVGV